MFARGTSVGGINSALSVELVLGQVERLVAVLARAHEVVVGAARVVVIVLVRRR